MGPRLSQLDPIHLFFVIIALPVLSKIGKIHHDDTYLVPRFDNQGEGQSVAAYWVTLINLEIASICSLARG